MVKMRYFDRTRALSCYRNVVRGFFLSFIFSVTLQAQPEIPFEVRPLYDFGQPESLGLSPAPGVEKVTVFSPGKDDPQYNHGVVLYPYKNMLYAQWQGSAVD